MRVVQLPWAAPLSRRPEDRWAAAGAVIGMAVLMLVVLLVTDWLGETDVHSFVQTVQ